MTKYFFLIVASTKLKMVSFDVSQWPSVWPLVAHTWTWTAYQRFWWKFMITKNRALTRLPYDFSQRPSFFYPRWPIFDYDLETIKIIIPIKAIYSLNIKYGLWSVYSWVCTDEHVTDIQRSEWLTVSTSYSGGIENNFGHTKHVSCCQEFIVNVV